MAAQTADPRPLTGEPVSLDLLNTRWTADGEPLDLFAGAAGLTRVEGLALWLESVGLVGRFRADAATLVHLLTARESLARAVADPCDSRRPRTGRRRPRTRTDPRHPDRRRPGRARRVRRPRLGPGLAGRPRLPRPAGIGARPDPHLRLAHLRPALPRHLAQRHPALVLHGRLRQPREGLPSLRAHARALKRRKLSHPASGGTPPEA